MDDRKETPQPPNVARPGRDRIAVIVRDPVTVFVYWELNGPRSAEALAALGENSRWCLRVLNLSDGASTAVAVDPAARNHYLEVAPGTTYGFELVLTNGERWRSVCRTERVDMPPAEPTVRRPRPPDVRQAGTDPVREQHPAPIEVAGLRFETTPARHGSSSHARRPIEAEGAPTDAG
jgi:hypothetical protein